MVGKVALTRTLILLTGWNITGVWTAIYIAGPAYRVTVPACVLVATLRLKLKAQQEARLKAEQTKRLAKQKAEREANKTKRTWYLAIIFLIDLAVLAVFFIKREHHSSNNPNNSQKAVLKNSKTLATRTIKRTITTTQKHKTTPSTKTIKKRKPKSIKENKIPFYRLRELTVWSMASAV